MEYIVLGPLWPCLKRLRFDAMLLSPALLMVYSLRLKMSI